MNSKKSLVLALLGCSLAAVNLSAFEARSGRVVATPVRPGAIVVTPSPVRGPVVVRPVDRPDRSNPRAEAARIEAARIKAARLKAARIANAREDAANHHLRRRLNAAANDGQ